MDLQFIFYMLFSLADTEYKANYKHIGGRETNNAWNLNIDEDTNIRQRGTLQYLNCQI